jgi:hypothetical protein
VAFRHGKNAAFTINAKALAAYMDSLETSFDTDSADTTVFGATWKSALSGVPGGSVSIGGFYDPTATDGPGAVLFPLLLSGADSTALIYPGGILQNQSLYTVTTGARVTSYKESSAVGGVVTWTAEVALDVLPVRSLVP